MSRIRDAGDAALLLELDEVIDPQVNVRAIAAATAIRSMALPGVRDVVPTYRSVAVFFDPLVADVDALRRALLQPQDMRLSLHVGSTIEVPVIYGGEAGPDLQELARWAGLTPEEVVARHTAPAYRVFMLGFLPGFAYLASVDDRIAMPRRPTPRIRVPRGSVAIAGHQTGIYPRESPGGWQIIGRTSLSIFDPDRQPAALFAPGDTVRFRSASAGEAVFPSQDDRHTIATATAAVGPSLRTVSVVRPGLFTTIQDEGRWGMQATGVPVGGAIDLLSHRRANALVGNVSTAATLEVTLAGPELRFDHPARVAVTGADLQPTLDGRAVPPHAAMACRAGSVLRFGERVRGARAYVAFDGGLDVRPVLGSRATQVAAGLGPFGGRALVAGDCLPLGRPTQRTARAATPTPLPAGGARLRVLPGPQEDFFAESAFALLERTRFMVSPQSNRMGYRLTGAAVPRVATHEMISDAAFAGGIQVPASGEPILLMSDRHTTGGYPQIATVITADLPVAGQLAPGDWVEFERCTRADAIAALRERMTDDGR